MAATCPKCGAKLRLFDWKPNCPHCGVNMVYYGLEDRLLLDADNAEIEHVHTQARMDRMKAAFTGSKLAITRIVTSVLPFAGLFLPLAKFSFDAPYASFNGSINAISLYNILATRLDFDALLSMFGSKLMGPMAIFFAVSIVTILLSAVGLLLHLIFLIMACGPKGKQRNYSLNILNILFSSTSLVTFLLFSSKIKALLPGIVHTSSLGIGIFVYLALLIACFVVDILCFKKGIPVKYKPCFVGNIPSDEYFRLVKEEVPLPEIRKIMAEYTAIKEAEDAQKKAEEEAKKAKEKAEKEAKEAAMAKK